MLSHVAAAVCNRLVKTLAISMLLMGVALSSGVTAFAPGDDCPDACPVDCSGPLPCDAPSESHDEDCPPAHHHHGCVHSVGFAWLVDWEVISLPGPCLETGSLNGNDEFPPDDPVFVLDKPPLI